MRWVKFRTHIRHLSEADAGRVKQAYALGEKVHEGQKRKSGEPYFTHPIAVAKILADMEADADTLIAALLHDAIEDTPLTLEEVDKTFDSGVRQLIDGVTKLEKEELSDKPTVEEEMETLRKIFTWMEQDVRIMIIKLADRMHNMQTVEFLDPHRQQVFAQQTLDVFVKIADRLCMHDFHNELEALCMVILEPKLYPELERLRTESRKPGEQVVELMQNTMQDFAPEMTRTLQVIYEPKAWNKVRQQYELKGEAITGVSAHTAAFICEEIQGCYEILGVLHRMWNREILSFEDFINAPMINGYQGLHTTVILEDGTRVRCKIRTEEMQTYARKGVTSQCFDSEAVGLLDYIPWTQRITTLSDDTAEYSDQFWESLQSDILGETIVIHGPNDRTIALPKGATALDGVLYLFEEKALNAESIKIDGKDVSFFTPLEHAATIDFTLAHKATVKREWLEWVQTGFATALIRNVLSRRTDRQKIFYGRQLLQEAMTKQELGYLSEFKEEKLLAGLRALGYSTIRDAIIAIADGHLEPSEAISMIFRPKNSSDAAMPKKQYCVVSFVLPMMSLNELADQFAFVEKKYGISLSDIQLHPTTNNQVNATILLALSAQEQQIIEHELSVAITGITNITINPHTSTLHLFSSFLLVLLLWGMDPVFARLLILHDHLTAIDFTLLRFWSLTLIMLIVTSFGQRRKILQPLHVWNPLLWSSAILLTLVALTTYAALEGGTATHYEIVMTASVLLSATVLGSLSCRKGLPILALFGFVLFLLWHSPAWNMQSGIYMLLSLVCFTAFLFVSNRYLQQESIARRRMEYYTAMLTIGSICTLPLLAFVSPAIRNPMTILRVCLFSILFIGLPYYLYYEWSPKQKKNAMIPFAFIMLTVTFIGELILTRQFDWFTLLAFTAMVLTAYLLEKPQKLWSLAG